MFTDCRILIVEDDDSKLRALVDFVKDLCARDRIHVVEAKSHMSAVQAVEQHRFHIAIFDMSLPSFDLAKDIQGGGGPPMGFGGRELLRLIEAVSEDTKAVVVTQFGAFSESLRGEKASFAELKTQLSDEFGDMFLGMVYYEGKQGAWRAEMKKILATAGLGLESK